MDSRPTDYLTESQRDFLRAIDFIPPPVKITPPSNIDSLFDELEELLQPIRGDQYRRTFQG